ncbi:MAG: phosphoribosylformylglycinamidine synthase [Anaeromyxobacter sp.]|nr:phosphoribosylformylglycinamidine synthase [Anaeromyxobacter sp.]MBL0277519.1 phosphoribosylformylglycinamidine synthase [Anaeromyxobacter sp.]
MADVTRIEIATRASFADSRGLSVARAIREHLGLAVAAVRTRDVFHVEPALPPAEAARVAAELAGPVVRQGAVGRLEDGPFDVVVSVGTKPGVTDPVGKSALVAIQDLLGRPLGDHAAVYASRLYLLSGVTKAQATLIATRLLANEVIERIVVATHAEWQAAPPDLTVPRVVEHPPRPTLPAPLAGLDDAALARLSREKLLALSVEELRTIRAHFERAAATPRRAAAGLGAAPTDAELECLAQTWSEHCKHKIFNATITYREPGQPPEEIRSLFKRYIRGTTAAVDEAIVAREGKSWLVSVFHDNAGVIAATDAYHLVFKVETHNSPSALDPYGGAMTGIVGVNRDPFGTGLGADLLSNVWGYCFGPPGWAGELPPGLLHPRRIREGVHHGVIDGGNQSGIPYGRGWEYFDERYLGKPLVYCGTVGRMPAVSAGRPTHVKLARPGDRIVMVGGRIGKDGIHGATFSSAELTEESPVQAVQIGDPITQKMMFDFLLEARDRGLYSAITDNGAGGLSSSVGEMATQPGGAWLDLARAPLKYQGLAPWEILVSEAQERMTLAVPPDQLPALLELARLREVEATDLGAFTDDGHLEVRFGAEVVALLPLAFLHDGDPGLVIEAVWTPPPHRPAPPLAQPADAAAGSALLAAFLGRDNLCSSEQLGRTYDHEVKALSVVKPWVGVHRDVPSDAAVFMIAHDAAPHGYAVSEAVFPGYSDHDAHAMAQAGVDLAVRRVVCAGARADRIAALDNYCWPDPLPGPTNPDAAQKAAQLVRASKGLSEICVAYGVPLISGKDSMKNDAVVGGVRISIPPTLLASTIALVPDVRRAVTLEAAVVGEVLILVGDSREELGGTEWAGARGLRGGEVPRCRPAEFWPRYEAVARAIRDELVVAAHAVGRGGLATSLFLMARASGMGLGVNLSMAPCAPGTSWEGLLYGETPGRLLLACRPERMDRLRKQLGAAPHAVIGSFTASPRLKVALGDAPLVDAPVADLARAWKREGGAA